MPLGKAIEYGSLSARCHVLRSRLLSITMLEELSRSRGIGELVGALSATPYGPFITEASTEGVQQGLTDAFAYYRKKISRELPKKHRELFALFFDIKYRLLDEKLAEMTRENSEEHRYQIDKNYIKLLQKSIEQAPASQRHQLQKIVGSYFDLLNLYNLVKFRLLYQLSTEETLSYMLPFSEKFSIRELAEISTAESLQQLSNTIEPILHDTFESYEGFRQLLYRYHTKTLLAVWSGYPFSITIPFSLLRLIEIEVSNLRAITEGVSFGLDKRDIMSMIVGD